MAEDFAKIGVVSPDPLVTYSSRYPAALLGVASAHPELFRGRRSLHFVGLTWALTDAELASIVEEYGRLKCELPDASIVILSNEDHGLFRLTGAGICAIPGNTSLFIDERKFKPLPSYAFEGATYDAIYNARLERYKRHELARDIDRLALIYDLPFVGKPSLESEIRELLPRARYLNHDLGGGKQIWLGADAIAREINRARCGLCLSEVEGSMRGSVEYLFCGVPVVSTKSIGGRDRYYGEPYTIIAEDNPDSVTEAVAELGKRRLNKLDVRDHIGRIVGHERRNLIDAINRIALEMFGVKSLFESLEAFVRVRSFPIAADRGLLNAFAEAQGVRLAPSPIYQQ